MHTHHDATLASDTLFPVRLVDTHCHLDLQVFDPDREAVLARARHLGVGAIVVPGVCAGAWEDLLQICGQHSGLFPAIGLHPVYVARHARSDLLSLERLLAVRSDVVAVGEIGLDFYVRGLDRQEQLHLFEAQLVIAREAGLPVILHVRKSHDEVLKALRRAGVGRGIAHAFNGSLQQAGQYIELGMKLGFGGMLTFERSRKLRALARKLPLEAMVLETDAPDMTVAQHRGERNSPEYLPFCLQALAEVREQDEEALALQTTRNARLALPGLGAALET